MSITRSVLGTVSRRVVPALAALRRGQLVVLCDQGGDRADLVAAAQLITADGINFMARHGRGLVCLALGADVVDRLRLLPMARGWERPASAFTVSIEARQGITTGISARERAHTVRVAVDAATRPEDLVTPGHIFPLRVRPGGLRGGGGRTEAAFDLAAASGRGEGAVLTEILDEDGELASLPDAARLAARHGLPLLAREHLLGFLRAQTRDTLADLPAVAPATARTQHSAPSSS